MWHSYGNPCVLSLDLFRKWPACAMLCTRIVSYSVLMFTVISLLISENRPAGCGLGSLGACQECLLESKFSTRLVVALTEPAPESEIMTVLPGFMCGSQFLGLAGSQEKKPHKHESWKAITQSPLESVTPVRHRGWQPYAPCALTPSHWIVVD